MSLHITNLSPRIRKDEIERVFRRFGRCSVHLRKGYGFVVYDFPRNAENALKSLNCTTISGETINLSWSSQQLKPLQRFERSAKVRDVQYGRNADINAIRSNFPRDQKSFSVHDKHPEDSGGTRKCTDIQNDRRSFNPTVKLHNQRQESLGKGGPTATSQVDCDSRDAQQDNLQSGNVLDGPMGSDRYEPDSDGRGEQSGNFALGGYRDNMRNRGCFKCGATGHKMRDCPLKDASQGKVPYHSDRLDNPVDTKSRGRDSDGGREFRPVERLRSFSRSLISKRRHETDRKLMTVETSGVRESSSPILSVSRRNSRNDQNKKRRRERGDQIFKTHHDKKSRISSVKASPGLGVRSRSQSPVSHFCSGTSMSKSKSNRSPRSLKPKSKSKSKSRSKSPNSSLPIGPHGALSPSPSSSELSLNAKSPPGESSPPSKQVHVTSDQIPRSENVVLEKGLSPQSKHVPLTIDQIPQSEIVVINKEESLSGCMDDGGSHEFKEVPKLKDEILTSINCPELSGISKSGLVPQAENMVLVEGELYQAESTQIPQSEIVVINKGESLSGCMDDAGSQEFKEVPILKDEILTSINCPELSGTFKSGLVPQAENMVLVEGELYQAESTQAFECQITDVPVVSEYVSLSNGVLGDSVDLQVGLLHNDDDKKNTGEDNIIDDKIAAENQRENVKTLEMPKSLEPTKKVDSEKALRLQNHLSISNVELYRVLKCYGLEEPEENEEHLAVEDYFGAARLWPWEMIYYRRLKKGLISTENYARRVAQNNAFRITDKYIRRSSGWDELIDEFF